jgi:hypothetical protein
MKTKTTIRAELSVIFALASLLWTAGCIELPAEGIAPAGDAEVVVVHDFFHRPLPEIPLPNDIATRADATSPTGRRVNASLVAPTAFERKTRTLVDTLDGWATYGGITIPFSGLIDIQGLFDRHHLDDYAFDNDAVYLIDVTEGSPTFGEPVPLDICNGNFPHTLEQLDGYWGGDARGDTLALLYEEHSEDTNGNGELDQGEDTDLDGHLDVPNYVPAETRTKDEMTKVERADALMTCYERETNTLIVRPLKPLRERTRYAVVVTRRLQDMNGKAVGSPYAWVNHTYHTAPLQPLEGILSANRDTYGGMDLGDVAFAWTYTTGSQTHDLRAVRDGLYGHGVQAHLAEDFPAKLVDVAELFNEDGPMQPHENVWIASGERFKSLMSIILASGLLSAEGEARERLLGSMDYVDYHVFGSFESPQLFDRFDEDGHMLGWMDMHWPADVSTKATSARGERLTFWLTVPRKEVSPRKDGKPAPLVVLGHGYGSNKTELIQFHGFFAKMGLATLVIENVSHGLDVSPDEQAQIELILAGQGVPGLADALLDNRALDFDGNGLRESAADFWTAYSFHTRDVVRQSAVDYLQLIRLVRSWDGSKQWDMGDEGPTGVAGDFDGDGNVDIGGPDSTISMVGGSLGGIMSAIMGGLEPHLDAVVPVAGGGGLSHVGIRSIQGGVRESLQLRVMGPLYVGETQPDGEVIVRQVVPDLNSTGRVEVFRVPKQVKLSAGDGVLIRNLTNGEYDCALVKEDGSFRVGVGSSIDFDHPEQHIIRFYSGNPFDASKRDPEKHRACSLLPGVGQAIWSQEEFGNDVSFHHRARKLEFRKGDPLSPIAEGMGVHRARPQFRRFVDFLQLVVDPADPVTYSQHFHSGEITYATGETVSTSALVVNTIGDMNVPVSTGASIARAAGLLDYHTPIEAWGGRTVNQALIDTRVLEAVDKVPHFVDPQGNGVLYDPENLSGSPANTLPSLGEKVAFSEDFVRGPDGYTVPRLDPPLHEHAIVDDPRGGKSGGFFPFVIPTGQHGMWFPGQHTDAQLQWCEDGGKTPAECAAETWFDHGSYLFQMFGYYLVSGGKELRFDACMSTEDCPDIPPPPAAR